MRHSVDVRDQPEIEQKFALTFEACEALDQFARQHRPRQGEGFQNSVPAGKRVIPGHQSEF